MIRAGRAAAGAEPEVSGALRDAFEERCTAVGCVPEASLARLTGLGLEDERAAREEEGFVTDES
jgi:hypothetical protein